MRDQRTARKFFTVMWISFVVLMSTMIGGEYLHISESSPVGWLFTFIGYASFLTMGVSMIATVFYWVAKGQ
jgi:hypothetical protein